MELSKMPSYEIRVMDQHKRVTRIKEFAPSADDAERAVLKTIPKSHKIVAIERDDSTGLSAKPTKAF